VPHKKEIHTTRPSREIPPVSDPAAVFESFPAFKLDRQQAKTIYDEIVDGLKRLPDLMEVRRVSRRDRAILTQLMRHAFNPPAIKDAP